MNYKFLDKLFIKNIKDEVKSNGWKYRLVYIYEESSFGDYILMYKINMFIIGSGFIAHITDKHENYCYTIFKDDKKELRFLIDEPSKSYKNTILDICKGYLNDYK